ncbi:MAG: trimethylamine methyltransferase family protein [Neomegalonema sp.]|nr:trimethylamine methyltransferase family protein [Neomegalonema sp.]
MSDPTGDGTGGSARRGRRGGGGAAARRAARLEKRIFQAPAILRQLPVMDLLSLEAIEIIERNAETILEEIGVTFVDNPAALARWREAGADVVEDRVRIPRGLARTLCASAPSHFELQARNPERSVPIGGSHTVFAPVYGPPFVSDLDQGRRYATMADFEKLVKLVYMSPHLHISGGTLCEPTDIAVNKRHLDMVSAHLRWSDKPVMGSVTAPQRAADSVELVKIAFGDQFRSDQPSMVSLININSPLSFDGTMMQALEVYAEAGQACIVSPFIVGGAMAPVSIAGTLAQVLAEALAGIAYSQLVKPGAPVLFGAFVSSIDMNSGAPSFGTPEAATILAGAAQLARRLNLPFRSGGALCGSKAPDAQAAFESASTLWPTMTSGVNFALHAAGWLEGGLVASFEKLVMDADQLGALQRFAGSPIDLSENGQALDAVREVGPGGHYLGCAHTQANFQTAYWRSDVADYRPYETWAEDGAIETAARANARWKQLLAEYQAPTIDSGVDEALQEFVTRRKQAEPDAFV